MFFTLKLYKRVNGFTSKRILSFHHVDSLGIGPETLVLRVFKGDYQPFDQEFFIGRRDPEMTAIDDANHWEWALLENANGKTTEHFRPYTYDVT